MAIGLARIDKYFPEQVKEEMKGLLCRFMTREILNVMLVTPLRPLCTLHQIPTVETC